MSFEGKRYWLVGASEGLGLALARALSARGAHLILSARDPARLEAARLSLAHPGRAECLVMDVASTASVEAGVGAAGQIDGLVWLAGVYWPMTAAEIRPAEAEAMCNINLTGCIRLVSRVLPGMIARGAGHIVLTGSLAGYRGLPGAVGYAASKAGVMVLAESLQADLRGSGVRVQLANPGFIRTRLTDKNDFAMPFLMEPEAAAAQMLRLMESRSFKRAFPFAFASLFRMGQFLPDWAYFRLFAPRKA